VKNIFYNHISADKIDMIDKLAYLYWYESVQERGLKPNSQQTQLYENTRQEVLDYGYKYFENNRN
jgi:hypothetical protein